MESLIRTGISYFGNRNPRHFLADLEEMKSHHCNFIVHTFSENDQLFYKYTLAELIKLSKAAGLEVYVDPWGVLRIFGGEATSDFAFKHREICQILHTGETAPGACLNHPQSREFMFKWIDDAVEIGAAVLFWDEPHFFIAWSKVAAIPSLDIFGTDPYWLWFKKPVAEFVGDFSREVMQMARQFHKEPQI